MPRPGALRSVEGMASTTSTIPLPRHRELSTAAALLLTIGGNILVVTIAAIGVAGVAAAAVAVFGPQLMEML